MKKWLKRIVIFFAALLVLFAALVAFTQTRTFKDWLRDQIVQQASQQLNGALEIGRIDGNLVSNFMLSRLLLKTADDTLAYLPKVTVRLQPSLLFDRKILLNVVALDSPYVKLVQTADSLWNAAGVVKESTDGAQDSEPFLWQIALEKATFSNGDIRIIPATPLPGVPQRIYGLNAGLSARYKDESLTLDLEKLTFQAQQPDFVVQKIALQSSYADSTLALKNLQLLLPETTIDATITLRLTELPDYRFQLAATPLSLDELSRIVPEVAVAGKPVLTLEGQFAGDSLAFKLNIREQQSELSAQGVLANLSATPHFRLKGELDRLQLARWYPALDSLQIPALTGTFTANGSGDVAENAVVDLTIDLRNSQFREMRLERTRLVAHYRRGRAAFDLVSRSDFGRVSFSGTIEDALHTQRFDVKGQLQHFDFSKLLLADSLATDINLTFSAKGRGLQPDAVVAGIALDMAPSTLAGLTVDTLFFDAHVERSDFAIDTLQLESSVGNFYLAGAASLDSENDLRFRGTLGDMRWVAAQVGADTLRLNGELDGLLRGPLNALGVTVQYRLADFSYNDVRIDSLGGNAAVHFQADSLRGELTSHVQQAVFAGFDIDSIAVHTDFSQSTAEVDITLAKGADFTSSSQFTFHADSIMRIDLASLDLKYKNQLWTTPENQAVVTIVDSMVTISGFRLSSGNQSIAAEGALRPDSEQDIELRIENLDLPKTMQVIDPTIVGIKGRLHMDAALTGTLAAPKVQAKAQIRNGALTKVTYDSLNLNIDYEQAVFSWLFQLYNKEKLTLRGDGFVPLDLMAPDSVDMLDLEKPFRFQAATPGIDLSFLQSFTKEVKNLQGLFVCDVRIENTLRDPEPVGHISIFNGAFSFPQYGMNYKDIQTRLQVDKESIRVTEFDVGTETKVLKGFFRRKKDSEQRRRDMRGRLWIVPGSYIDFDSTGFLSGVDSMNMKLRANEFLLANNSDYQAQINADINVFGNVNAPRFDGTVRVLRSSLYLPALEATGLYDEEQIQSLLRGAIVDTVQADAPEESEAATWDYFNNLRGSLKIEIPKNAWVRGPDMNIELAGTLDLVKDGAEFEQPFGTIQVVRGTYDLFNAYKFDIEEGEMFFEGGQEFDPRLDIKAKHTIRTQNREIHDLRLHVTNRMFAPEMKFFLDGDPVEITEALRFLVTGGHGKGGAQSSGLFATNGGREASGMLAGLLTSQLSRFLMNNQILDVLEVKGDLTGEQASIVLGKYITNKLFLSLQKAIKLGSNNDEGISDEVTIEYALSRYLILQAIAGDERTTGFDIFWKFSKE